MSFAIDESTPFGARAAAHLREDKVAWLTTVSASGAPLPSPVWFLWEEPDHVLMFSRDGVPRLRNLDANPRVALNFAGDGRGGDIVVLSGRASIERDAPAAHEVPAYCAKYAWGFERLGKSAEEFSAAYPVPVRIALSRLRGH